MKKKYVKIVIIISSIILLLVAASVCTFLVIQRQKHIAELEQVELPEIVFKYSLINKYNNYTTRIIDKYGNVYLLKGTKKREEIFSDYNSGILQQKWTYLGQIDVIELKEKYCLFLELKNTPGYGFFYDEDVPKGIGNRVNWYGYYYENGKIESFIFYEREYVAPNVTDERGKELAGWVSAAVYD